MGNQVMAYAKEYFYFVIIGGGLIIVIGCIFNWNWATSIISPSKLPMIRGFIDGLHGEEALHKFERSVNLICGLILIVAGIIYWHFYG